MYKLLRRLYKCLWRQWECATIWFSLWLGLGLGLGLG